MCAIGGKPRTLRIDGTAYQKLLKAEPETDLAVRFVFEDYESLGLPFIKHSFS